MDGGPPGRSASLAASEPAFHDGFSELITGSMPPPRVAPFEPDQLWQQAREPIFWLDPALKLTWVNRAWEKLTGHPAESVVGLTCQAHGPTGAGDLADLAASFHPPPESLAGQPTGTTALIFHAGGGGIWHRVEFWPFRDEHDALIGLLGLGSQRGWPAERSRYTRPTSFTSSCSRSGDSFKSNPGSTA